MRSPGSTKRKCTINFNSNICQDAVNNGKLYSGQGFEDVHKQRLYKSCSSNQCIGLQPICFLRISPLCSANYSSARWTHISRGEHFCHYCYEYFSSSSDDNAYREFDEWRRQWLAHVGGTPSVKEYAVNERLPYWAQCINCHKWRQLPRSFPSLNQLENKCNKASKRVLDSSSFMYSVTPEFLAQFSCSHLAGKTSTRLKQLDAENICKWEATYCEHPEDERVALTLQSRFWSSIYYVSLLQNSPAAELLQPYRPNEVGLALGALLNMRRDSEFIEGSKKIECEDLHWTHGNMDIGESASTCECRLHCCVKPFYLPSEQQRALSLLPNSVQPEELREFPIFERQHALYLGMRNTLIALWSLDVRRCLTTEFAANHMAIRGLIRIAALAALPAMMTYFTCRGLINVSLPDNGRGPERPLLSKEFRRHSVLVVGAGAAGLAAARQLHNFGCSVSLLEADSRIGGRIFDFTVPSCVLPPHLHDHLSPEGLIFPVGASLIQGCINNPLSLLAIQIGATLRPVSERADLFFSGRPRCAIVDAAMERRTDLIFCSALDALSNGRCRSSSLAAALDIELEMLRQRELCEDHAAEDDALFHFYRTNLEYSTGAPLSAQSAAHWDAHENFAQFHGAMAEVNCGLAKLLERLADGLDVRLGERVVSVQIEKTGGVLLRTATGSQHRADRLLLTLPPSALLQLEWTPALPQAKLTAARRFGAGVLETVTLVFADRWWDVLLEAAQSSNPDKPAASHWLGRLPAVGEALDESFHLVRDFDPVSRRWPLLQTLYSGLAAEKLAQLDDAEVITRTLRALGSMLPAPTDTNVVSWPPAPVWTHVSNWRQGFSSVFPDDVDTSDPRTLLAESLHGVVFFAGEATNTHFPQTVAGAYLSGLREAGRIAESSAFTRL